MSGLRRTRAGENPEVQRITGVRRSLAEDIAERNRRYLIQMSTRVVCFIGAVVIDHWTRWILLAGAVFLPYVAVVLANAGRERSSDPGTYVEMEQRSLPAAPVPPPTRTGTEPDAGPTTARHDGGPTGPGTSR